MTKAGLNATNEFTGENIFKKESEGNTGNATQQIIIYNDGEGIDDVPGISFKKSATDGGTLFYRENMFLAKYGNSASGHKLLDDSDTLSLSNSNNVSLIKTERVNSNSNPTVQYQKKTGIGVIIISVIVSVLSATANEPFPMLKLTKADGSGIPDILNVIFKDDKCEGYYYDTTNGNVIGLPRINISSSNIYLTLYCFV